MTERIQTLMACEHCGRGYPIRELVNRAGQLVCESCARKVDDHTYRELFRKFGKPYGAEHEVRE